MTKHEHGTVDIKEHEETFHRFVKIVAWSMVAIIVFLVFLAIVNA